MGFFEHEFDAPVAHHDVGSDKYRYTVVYVPDSVAAALPLDEYPRLRVNAEIDDYPLDAALTPVRGVWYIMLSKKTLSAIERRVGDIVTVRFRVADQDAVDMPDALLAALRGDARMQPLWDALTPGKKRSLAHRVGSAKSPETQARRIAEVFDIMTGKRDAYGKLVEGT